MDFHGLKRKELQELCKKHGIPANLKNVEMEDRLSSLIKEENNPTKRAKSCLKRLSDEEVLENREPKKVKFSPQNETFIFEKTDPREMRLRARKMKAFPKSQMEENPVVVSIDDGRILGKRSCVVKKIENFSKRSSRRKSVVPEILDVVDTGIVEVNNDVKRVSRRMPIRTRANKVETEINDEVDEVVMKGSRQKSVIGKQNEVVDTECVEEVEKHGGRITRRRASMVNKCVNLGSKEIDIVVEPVRRISTRKSTLAKSDSVLDSDIAVEMNKPITRNSMRKCVSDEKNVVLEAEVVDKVDEPVKRSLRRRSVGVKSNAIENGESVDKLEKPANHRKKGHGGDTLKVNESEKVSGQAVVDKVDEPVKRSLRRRSVGVKSNVNENDESVDKLEKPLNRRKKGRVGDTLKVNESEEVSGQAIVDKVDEPVKRSLRRKSIGVKSNAVKNDKSVDKVEKLVHHGKKGRGGDALKELESEKVSDKAIVETDAQEKFAEVTVDMKKGKKGKKKMARKKQEFEGEHTDHVLDKENIASGFTLVPSLLESKEDKIDGESSMEIAKFSPISSNKPFIPQPEDCQEEIDIIVKALDKEDTAFENPINSESLKSQNSGDHEAKSSMQASKVVETRKTSLRQDVIENKVIDQGSALCRFKEEKTSIGEPSFISARKLSNLECSEIHDTGREQLSSERKDSGISGSTEGLECDNQIKNEKLFEQDNGVEDPCLSNAYKTENATKEQEIDCATMTFETLDVQATKLEGNTASKGSRDSISQQDLMVSQEASTEPDHSPPILDDDRITLPSNANPRTITKAREEVKDLKAVTPLLSKDDGECRTEPSTINTFLSYMESQVDGALKVLSGSVSEARECSQESLRGDVYCFASNIKVNNLDEQDSLVIVEHLKEMNCKLQSARDDMINNSEGNETKYEKSNWPTEKDIFDSYDGGESPVLFEETKGLQETGSMAKKNQKGTLSMDSTCSKTDTDLKYEVDNEPKLEHLVSEDDINNLVQSKGQQLEMFICPKEEEKFSDNLAVQSFPKGTLGTITGHIEEAGGASICGKESPESTTHNELDEVLGKEFDWQTNSMGSIKKESRTDPEQVQSLEGAKEGSNSDENESCKTKIESAFDEILESGLDLQSDFLTKPEEGRSDCGSHTPGNRNDTNTHAGHLVMAERGENVMKNHITESMVVVSPLMERDPCYSANLHTATSENASKSSQISQDKTCHVALQNASTDIEGLQSGKPMFSDDNVNNKVKQADEMEIVVEKSDALPSKSSIHDEIIPQALVDKEDGGSINFIGKEIVDLCSTMEVNLQNVNNSPFSFLNSEKDDLESKCDMDAMEQEKCVKENDISATGRSENLDCLPCDTCEDSRIAINIAHEKSNNSDANLACNVNEGNCMLDQQVTNESSPCVIYTTDTIMEQAVYKESRTPGDECYQYFLKSKETLAREIGHIEEAEGASSYGKESSESTTCNELDEVLGKEFDWQSSIKKETKTDTQQVRSLDGAKECAKTNEKESCKIKGESAFDEILESGLALQSSLLITKPEKGRSDCGSHSPGNWNGINSCTGHLEMAERSGNVMENHTTGSMMVVSPLMERNCCSSNLYIATCEKSSKSLQISPDKKCHVALQNASTENIKGLQSGEPMIFDDNVNNKGYKDATQELDSARSPDFRDYQHDEENQTLISPMINAPSSESLIAKHTTFESNKIQGFIGTSGVHEVTQETLNDDPFALLKQEKNGGNSESHIEDNSDDIIQARMSPKHYKGYEENPDSHLTEKQNEIDEEGFAGFPNGQIGMDVDGCEASVSVEGVVFSSPCATESFSDKLQKSNYTPLMPSYERMYPTESISQSDHKKMKSDVEPFLFTDSMSDSFLREVEKDEIKMSENNTSKSNVKFSVDESEIANPENDSQTLERVKNSVDQVVNAQSSVKMEVNENLSHFNANNAGKICERSDDFDSDKLLMSSQIQRKNSRSILIHGTPKKPTNFIHEMKENPPTQKRVQMLNATVMKPNLKRKALQDIAK